MNYHEWKMKMGVNAVKSAGDNTYFFQRDGTDLGVLGVLFDGQIKKDPICDRLGRSPCFTDICKAIYNSLASSDRALHGMKEIQQVLIGAALIFGRIPINKNGTASYDKSRGQAFHHLPFNSIYKSAFEVGFRVGLLADDLIAVMDASRKDNSEWRGWFATKRDFDESSPITQAISYNYLPTKEDFESAFKMSTLLGERGNIDAILDQIEINAMKVGYSLKNNWRMITEKNVEIWSRGA